MEHVERPGLPEAVFVKSRRHGWLLQRGVTALLGLCRRDVSDQVRAEQPILAAIGGAAAQREACSPS
jgi:hypothetical protein